MALKYYDKLVRDKIPSELQEKGMTVVSYVADIQEYTQKLLLKLLEEAEEFQNDPCVEELADIREVLEAIKNTFNVGSEDFLSYIDEDEFNLKVMSKEDIITLLLGLSKLLGKTYTNEKLFQILSIVDYIRELFGFDLQELEKARWLKFANRGGFDDRIILVSVDDNTE